MATQRGMDVIGNDAKLTISIPAAPTFMNSGNGESATTSTQGSGSATSTDKDKNSSTGKKQASSQNNQTVSSVPGNDSKSGTSNNVATIQQQDLMNFQPQNPITPVDNTYVASKTAPIIANSVKSIKSNTQPQNTNQQIIDESIRKNNLAQMKEHGSVEWCKNMLADRHMGSNHVAEVRYMLDGRCQVTCDQGYVFNNSSKECEQGILGFQTGYLN